MSAFHFIRPVWLLGIPLAVWVWWLLIRQRDPAERWKGIVSPELLPHLLVGSARRSRIFSPHHALLAIWLVAVVAAAGPTWRPEPSPFADERAPVMIVLAVTPSMQESDVPPTRLERAQQKISVFVKERPGAPNGLVAYAGSAHLVLPPTRDAEIVSTMAASLAPDVMPKEGDDLPGALRVAARAMEESGRPGSILVLADSVTPENMPRSSDEKFPPVQILAMHSAGGGDASLRQAAEALGGRLVPLSIDTSDVTSLARRATSSSVAVADAEADRRWQESGFWLMPLVALGVLLWFRRGWVLGGGG